MPVPVRRRALTPLVSAARTDVVAASPAGCRPVSRGNRRSTTKPRVRTTVAVAAVAVAEVVATRKPPRAGPAIHPSVSVVDSRLLAAARSVDGTAVGTKALRAGYTGVAAAVARKATTARTPGGALTAIPTVTPIARRMRAVVAASRMRRWPHRSARTPATGDSNR